MSCLIAIPICRADEETSTTEKIISDLYDFLSGPSKALFKKMGDDMTKKATARKKGLPVDAIHDDQPPELYPHEWDSIASREKKCWYHKITQKKVCTPI